jgi:Transcription factor/nuclear export subunit protein 2
MEAACIGYFVHDVMASLNRWADSSSLYDLEGRSKSGMAKEHSDTSVRISFDDYLKLVDVFQNRLRYAWTPLPYLSGHLRLISAFFCRLLIIDTHIGIF